MTTATMAIAAAAVAAAVVAGARPGAARLRRILDSRSRTQGGAGVGGWPATSGATVAPRALDGGARPTPGPGRGVLASAPARVVAVVTVGIAAMWLVGGSAAPAIGGGVALAAWVWSGRRDAAAVVRAREDAVAALPLTAELLSAAVAAGSAPVVAAEAVGAAVGGRLGAGLEAAAAAARIGLEPSAAWASLAADPVLRPLARALAGADTHGVSPVAMLQRVAEDARDTARWDAQARARALGARAAAPLGLCFLPAFVLVGIVPVVAGAGPLLP
jgi:Flp pilus assembly protein TadB